MKIVIGNKHEKYTMTIPVSVLMIDDGEIPPILGRKGFFDEFSITFEETKEKIHLRKIQTFNRKTSGKTELKFRFLDPQLLRA